MRTDEELVQATEQQSRKSVWWKRWWVWTAAFIVIIIAVSSAATSSKNPTKAGVSSQADVVTNSSTERPISADEQSSPADAPTAPAIEAAAPAPPPKIAPIRIAGRNKSASKKFSLGEGVAEFHMTYKGSSNFIVDLLDASDGSNVDNLSNAIGSYNGTRILGVGGGRYLLQVDGDGSWNITVTQPRPTSGKSAPASVSGSGDGVVGPFDLSAGLSTFGMRFKGQENFIVDLLDADGNNVDNLANEIGSWSGTQAESIPDAGLYWVSVQGTGGKWTISVE